SPSFQNAKAPPLPSDTTCSSESHAEALLTVMPCPHSRVARGPIRWTRLLATHNTCSPSRAPSMPSLGAATSSSKTSSPPAAHPPWPSSASRGAATKPRYPVNRVPPLSHSACAELDARNAANSATGRKGFGLGMSASGHLKAYQLGSVGDHSDLSDPSRMQT